MLQEQGAHQTKLIFCKAVVDALLAHSKAGLPSEEHGDLLLCSS